MKARHIQSGQRLEGQVTDSLTGPAAEEFKPGTHGPGNQQCPYSQVGDQDLAERLRRIANVEPIVAIVIATMLDGRQWEALRSGRAFDDVVQRLTRVAATRLRRFPAKGTTREDLAQTVIARLGDIEIFRTFIASRGTPAGFLGGVFGFQMRDAIRSATRLKNRPLASWDENAGVASRPKAKHVNVAWSIEDLRGYVLRLPPAERTSVIRRHPELGLDEFAVKGLGNSRKLYRHGIALLRQLMA